MTKGVKVLPAGARNPNFPTVNVVTTREGNTFPLASAVDDANYRGPTVQDSGGAVRGLKTYCVPNYTSDDDEDSGDTWPPADALVAIDFVGGTPQGRAWVTGTGAVAIDTLLGADENTANGWDTTSYSAEKIDVNGYTEAGDPVAFIGAARAALVAGCTMVLTFYTDGGISTVVSFVMVATDGNDGIVLATDTAGEANSVSSSTYNGDLEQTINDALNTSDDVSVLNRVALTQVGQRWEVACNGSAAASSTLSATDRPAENPFTAALLDIPAIVIQSITIYAALPSTAGLSALSELPD